MYQKINLKRKSICTVFAQEFTDAWFHKLTRRKRGLGLKLASLTQIRLRAVNLGSYLRQTSYFQPQVSFSTCEIAKSRISELPKQLNWNEYPCRNIFNYISTSTKVSGKNQRKILVFYKGLNGVNSQPSNSLKFNHQLSKKSNFYRQPSKKQLQLAVKRFQGLSNIIISAAHPGRLALKESF